MTRCSREVEGAVADTETMTEVQRANLRVLRDLIDLLRAERGAPGVHFSFCNRLRRSCLTTPRSGLMVADQWADKLRRALARAGQHDRLEAFERRWVETPRARIAAPADCTHPLPLRTPLSAAEAA
jgi:hypothetical protein